MKYLVFFAALAGIFPAVLLMVFDRRWIRRMMFCLPLPVLVFNSSAINFFSHETYRGTSRGMEISVIYMLAAALLMTFLLLGRRVRLFPDTGSLLYLAYFLFSLPSFFNTANALFGFFELWKMVMIYLVYLAVYHYLEYSRGDFDIILYGIAVVIAVDFLVIVRQHFQGFYQVRGVFPHQNSLAMCMMMSGLLFFSRFFNNREGFKSRIFLVAFLLASASLVRTYSRGALFCYPLGGALTLFCSFMKGFSYRKFYLTGALMVCGLIGFPYRYKHFAF